ncbi:hypothetical protein [Arthrobacter caoxuetaonis]|uniref:Uncharacterized protein n=1 Tax=Arthrobacter caoxuetaonis TaxID=2886935 RepID=A0A9X1MGS7_9MICC|nr:hypothetical protein [Arthrobacter caoxuetaonis]MCC3299526.1 hypothetical protein [Arthrobacter caoxuetaonis]USQ57776.1 hypothetical protein NF551_02650 [Arthrobacter caoxuetaonis]
MGTYNAVSRKSSAIDFFSPPAGVVLSGNRWLHASRVQTAQTMPVLSPGEVYVTRRGTAYHTGWCQVVQRTWEFNRPALMVSGEKGNRRLCRSCAEDSRGM